MGHDILISIDQKIVSQCYNSLLAYIGSHSKKINPKESDRKNGVRILLSHVNGKATKTQIKKFARSRLYFFQNTIVMDIEPSIAIYTALLESIVALGNDAVKVKNWLNAYFECIKYGNEQYCHCLAILEEIYRIIQIDALIHPNSNTLCNELNAQDNIL